MLPLNLWLERGAVRPPAHQMHNLAPLFSSLLAAAAACDNAAPAGCGLTERATMFNYWHFKNHLKMFRVGNGAGLARIKSPPHPDPLLYNCWCSDEVRAFPVCLQFSQGSVQDRQLKTMMPVWNLAPTGPYICPPALPPALRASRVYNLLKNVVKTCRRWIFAGLISDETTNPDSGCRVFICKAHTLITGGQTNKFTPPFIPLRTEATLNPRGLFLA